MPPTLRRSLLNPPSLPYSVGNPLVDPTITLGGSFARSSRTLSYAAVVTIIWSGGSSTRSAPGIRTACLGSGATLPAQSFAWSYRSASRMLARTGIEVRLAKIRRELA